MLTADGIAIAFRDDAGYVCRGSAGEAPALGTLINPGVGYCGACIQQGRTIVQQEIAGELGSLVAVPLIDGVKVTGCVAAFAFRRQAFSELEIEQLSAVASHLARYRSAAEVQVVAEETEPVKDPVAEEMTADEVLRAVLADPNQESPLFESASASGEHKIGTSSTVGIAIVVVLLIVVLVSLIGYRRQLPSPSTRAPALEQSVNSAERAAERRPTKSTPVGKAKTPENPRGGEKSDAARPIVVQNTGVARPKSEGDVQPPPVALQSATVAPDIPIIASVPTLAASALPNSKQVSSLREPRLVRQVSPKYPDLAKSAKLSGDVELELTVSERGDVSAVWIVRGPAVFASSAMEAVKQWRYVPAQLEGKNVESKLRLKIHFNGHK